MTNADRIRMMTDEELAIMFEEIVAETERKFMRTLADANISADLIQLPQASYSAQLEWLKEEAEE